MSAYQRRWVMHIRLKIWPTQWFAYLPWALPCTQHNIGPPAFAEFLGEVSCWSYTGRSPSIEHYYSRGASGDGTQFAWGDLHSNMTYLKETSAWKRFTLKNKPYYKRTLPISKIHTSIINKNSTTRLIIWRTYIWRSPRLVCILVHKNLKFLLWYHLSRYPSPISLNYHSLVSKMIFERPLTRMCV